MTVGFDRKIRTSWLDVTARLAAASLSPSTIRDELDEVLADEVSGEGPHSARGKTKTVLLRIWVTVPSGVVPLRDEALGVVGSGDTPDLRPLHWGMCLATYPFFRDTAAITGRLLSLQGSVTLAMVSRRIAERYGARSTVLRASQRVVRSMVEWDALRETVQRGVFRSGPSIGLLDAASRDGCLTGWLLEAALFASGRPSMRVESLARHPMLFPFRTGATARDAAARTRLDLFREGAGDDVVAWKEFPAAHG